MTNNSIKTKGSVTIGDGVVVVKRPHASGRVVATVLGTDGLGDDGLPSMIWLDRMVHRPGEEFEGWRASGAVSTVLTREVACG